MKKTCSKCKVEKGVSEFGSNKSKRDGLQAYCRPCASTAVLKTTRRLVLDTLTGETVTANALASRIRKRNGKYQEYLDNNPVKQLRQSIARLIVSSFKAKSWSKQTKTHALLGCSFEGFHKHLGPKPTEDAHIDHRIPCSCAQDEVELLALQHYSNLQYLPATENLSKSGSLPDNWEELKQDLLDLLWHREGIGEINLTEYLE